MTEPIVFISRNRVKEGMLEDFRQHYHDSLPQTKADKPGTIVQLAYVDSESTELVIVRLLPDAKALDWQLQGADQRSKAAYRYIEPTGVEIYGQPNKYALEIMKKAAGSGIKVSIFPHFAGGFTRLSSSGILL